jgi:hypothetical protein
MTPAKATGIHEQRLIVFRKSRDKIVARFAAFLAEGSEIFTSIHVTTSSG